VGDMRTRHHHQVPVVVGEAVEDGEGVRRAAENQVLPVLRLFGQVAEDASLLRPTLLDQLHPPRRPELIHHLTRSGAKNIRPPWEGTADRTPSVAPWNAPSKAPRIRSRSDSSCSRGGYCIFGAPLMPASDQAAAT